MKAINYGLWLIYFAFALAVTFVPAIAPAAAPRPEGGLLVAKILVGVTLFAFVAYSFYCSLRESLLTTVKRMFKFHWGRQICIDLYIGLLMFVFVLYLNEDSIWIMLLWLIPTLVYGNLVPLLYLLTRFDSLVAAFASGSASL